LDGRLATAAVESSIDDYIDRSLTEGARLGTEGVDVALSEVVDLTNPWHGVLRHSINNEWGVDPQGVSTLDIGQYRDTNENWPVEHGYGALVAQVAGEVVGLVELRTPVLGVEWGRSPIRVQTSKGDVETDAVIVTASTNVLADGVIRFSPDLPGWKRDAIAAVPLGKANKIGLLLDASVLGGVDEQNVAVPVGSDEMISVRLNPFGRPLADGYVGGPFSAELEAAGDAETVDVMLSALATILGSSVRNKVQASAVTRWASDPNIRGAYGAAVPGLAERRRDLGRPIDGRLFFAGEATSPDFFTTCHGAWQSGVATAEAVAHEMGKLTAATNN
jgi:monoamine oxidase